MTLEKQMSDIRFTLRVVLFLIVVLIVVQLWVVYYIAPHYSDVILFILIVPLFVLILVYACSNLNMIPSQDRPTES